MGEKKKFSLTRLYRSLHLRLRKRCDRLSQRERKMIVYSLSIVYLICAIIMITQLFMPKKASQEPPFSIGELQDAPIPKDTLQLEPERTDTYLSMNQYGH